MNPGTHITVFYRTNTASWTWRNTPHQS